MSGPHSAYRTPSRPVLSEDGEPMPAVDCRGNIRTRRVITSYDSDTRQHTEEDIPRAKHVLDFRPLPVRASKHAAGRIKPLTKEQRRKINRRKMLVLQLQRRITRDREALNGVLDAQ